MAFSYLFLIIISGGPVTQYAKEVELPKYSDEDCKLLYGVDTKDRLCGGENLAALGICPVSRHVQLDAEVFNPPDVFL